MISYAADTWLYYRLLSTFALAFLSICEAYFIKKNTEKKSRKKETKKTQNPSFDCIKEENQFDKKKTLPKSLLYRLLFFCVCV